MRWLSIIVVFLLPLSVLAQNSESANAVIRSHKAEFVMTSPTSAKLKVYTKITVFNSHGINAATFLTYNDGFRILSSFSGQIENNGKVLKKLKKSDVSSINASEDIGSDALMSIYIPNAPYPFDVTYEYVVDHVKGIISFPSFLPITEPDTILESSEYVLNLPVGTKVQYNSPKAPELRKEAKSDIYTWEFNNHNGFVAEHMMPGLLSLVPYVYACPVEFTYGGTKGSQENWNSAGKWLYSLQQDGYIVPEPLRAKIVSLTEGINDEKGKIKVVYDYLRENTRYVSIQLGIGGFKPFPVETVYKTGFGDCKALSAYMRALLEIVGISSEYVIVNTSKSELLKNYHSVGQMDHAMLCVPMQNDTLWVECTNPRYPLGYRHESVAGHEVVLIKQDGGELIKAANYPDSLRFNSESINVILNPNGSAKCVGNRYLKLDGVEPYIGFANLKPKDQFDIIMSGNSLIPTDLKVNYIKDNFDGWLKTDVQYIPELNIGYSYQVNNYGRVSGDRIFLQLNPFSKKIYADRKKRINRMLNPIGRGTSDTIKVVLPDGYIPEALPQTSSVESKFGTFKTEIVFIPKDENKSASIDIIQTLEYIPFDLPAEDYEMYRVFAKEVSKAYSAKIVLKRE